MAHNNKIDICLVMQKEQFVNYAGKKQGLEIWRIKNFGVIPIPQTEYGAFYEGDSYIVLSSYGLRDLRYNIHMWLGEKTTPDESGTAALKMVELDDSLGGAPVQYREVQNHESSLFLSYFKSGLRYLKGGYDAGFRKVKSLKREPRLFQCKGRHIVRVVEVELRRESLNLGDAFILDTPDKEIYIWLPPECSRLERIKAVQQGRNVRDQERAGQGELEILDADWDSNVGFWNFFGGKGHVKAADETESDEDFMNKQKTSVALYRVSDASGKLKMDKIADNQLNLGMLDKNDAFILDTGSMGVFVWVGKGCTLAERKNAMKWATEFLTQKGRPKWVQVVRVVQGGEPEVFMQWFHDPLSFKPGAFSGSGTPSTAKGVATSASPAASLGFVFIPTLFHCSNAGGKFRIREIPNFTQEDLNADDVMILDTGAVIYVWNGDGSNRAEKTAGQSIATKYLEISGLPRPASAKITTISQGNEPEHFIKHFKGWSNNYWSASALKEADLVKQMMSTRM